MQKVWVCHPLLSPPPGGDPRSSSLTFKKKKKFYCHCTGYNQIDVWQHLSNNNR